jgi:hypothetical protein
MQWAGWAVIWLTIGFALKWIREACQSICAWIKKGAPQMFNFLLVVTSFALIYVIFGILHVTTFQALLVLVFWFLISALAKDQFD